MLDAEIVYEGHGTGAVARSKERILGSRMVKYEGREFD